MRRLSSPFAQQLASVSTRRASSVFNVPARGLSFSVASSRQKPEFNVLLFCPRNEKHLEKFAGDYPEFIKSSEPGLVQSVSVTDVAHNPENNQRAVELLLGQGISPSMVVPHLASIAHSKEEADEKIKFFRDSGIKSIFVVRGNPLVIGEDESYTKHPQGYDDPVALIKRIKELAPDMKIIVAGYPEKHPYAKSFSEDLDELQKKVEAGADTIMLQHSFHNEAIAGFAEHCKKRGINLPIIPSIMPIGNPKYLFSFSEAAGVDVPPEVVRILFSQNGATVNDSAIIDKKIEEQAVAYTVAQIRSLTDLRLPQVIRLNIYTANRLPFLEKVFKALNIEKESAKEDSNRGGRV